MSSSAKKHLPRIAYAFATLLLALLFYGGVKLYTSSVGTSTTSESSTASAASDSSLTSSSSNASSSSSASPSSSATATSSSSSSSSKEAQSSSSAQEPKNDSTKDQAKKDKEEQEAKRKKEAEGKKEDTAAQPRETHYKLEGDTAAKVEKSDAYGALTQAIGSFEDKGYTVAFVVHDIKTGTELTYNSKEELYPASSIKAPFTTAIYQELVDKGEVKLEEVAPVAQETIIESSDEGYRALHASYGEQVFIKWLKDAGVEPGSYGTYEEMVSWNYPHICADQFSLMWQRIYAYLNTNTKASKQLGEYLEARTVSSLRKALNKDTHSRSKMGWFETESDYRSLPATVEGGVVYDKQNPYIIALMTSAPALLDELVPLEQAITNAHAAML